MNADFFYSEIGRRILALRRQKNLGQEELASILDLNRTSIVSIEKGKQKLTLFQLYQLCQTFKIDFKELVPFFDAESSKGIWEHKIEPYLAPELDKQNEVMNFILTLIKESPNDSAKPTNHHDENSRSGS